MVHPAVVEMEITEYGLAPMKTFVCACVLFVSAGEVLTTYDDPACSPCERNDGKCFDSDEDGLRDGCQCPASRSGENCGTIHGNIIT